MSHEHEEGKRPSLAEYERRSYDDEISRLKASNRDLERKLAEAEKTASFYYSVADHTTHVPKWLSKKPSKKTRHHVRAGLMLSDLHFQEVVDERATNGWNAYDHEISVERFERVIERAANHPLRYIGDRKLDGAVVCLGGDIITGTIHDELERTNDMTTSEAISFWAPKLASALTYLADTWDCPIVVPEIDGNHDRSYRRKHHKRKAQEAHTWVIYTMVNMLTADDDRITPLLASASEIVTPIYDLRVLWEHGDAGIGGGSGGGIGGIWPPIMRKLHKAHTSHRQLGLDFDYYVMGHWHQFTATRELLINNTLKGYDEFAMHNRFPPSPPSQAMFYVTPEHGLGDWHEVFAT